MTQPSTTAVSFNKGEITIDAEVLAPKLGLSTEALKVNMAKGLVTNIAETGVASFYLNVVVTNGIVDLWGVVSSKEERDAVRIAAESTSGVKAVQVHISANPQLLSGV
jgi:hypothetical protein